MPGVVAHESLGRVDHGNELPSVFGRIGIELRAWSRSGWIGESHWQRRLEMNPERYGTCRYRLRQYLRITPLMLVFVQNSYFDARGSCGLHS